MQMPKCGTGTMSLSTPLMNVALRCVVLTAGTGRGAPRLEHHKQDPDATVGGATDQSASLSDARRDSNRSRWMPIDPRRAGKLA
jgi:hypothetical protein